MFVTILVYFLGVEMMGDHLMRIAGNLYGDSYSVVHLKEYQIRKRFILSPNIKRKRVFRKHE
jgi:hypothetical protein